MVDNSAISYKIDYLMTKGIENQFIIMFYILFVLTQSGCLILKIIQIPDYFLQKKNTMSY